MAFVVRKPGQNSKVQKLGASAVLYGPPLVGKTSTLINDTEWRVLVIDLDKNSGVIAGAPNVTIVGVDTFEEYLSVKEGVFNGVWKIPGTDEEMVMDYDMYVIDSFTTMEEKIKQWVANTYAPNRKREIQGKFGAQTDWQDLQDREIQEVRDWQAMTKRANNPINVLWIGHDMDVTDEMGQVVTTRLMLQGRYAAPRIASAVDGMFYMFKQQDPKNPNVVHRGIFTIDQGKVHADARVPAPRRKKLPSVIWYPKWSQIFRFLNHEDVDFTS